MRGAIIELKRSLILFTILLSSFGADTALAKKRVRIMFEPIPEAKYHEVQFGNDAKFSKVTRKFKTRITSKIYTMKAPPRFVRIRGVFADGENSGWFTIRPSWWKPVRLPKVIRAEPADEGRTTIDWKPPTNDPDHEFTYHVQIFDKKRRQIYNGLVNREEFELPYLPGGDYVLSVEPVGDAQFGSIHVEGTGVALAKIQAAPVKYDPKTRTSHHKYTLLDRLNPFFPSFKSYSELSYNGNEYHRTLVLTQAISLTGESGWQLYGDFPMTLIESGTVSDPPPRAFRFGGSPFPQFSLGKRLSGDTRKYFAVRLQYTPSIDSSNYRSWLPNFLAPALLGRFSSKNGLWALDYQLSYGFGFSKRSTNSLVVASGAEFRATRYAKGTLALDLSRRMNSKVRAGMKLFYSYNEAIRLEVIESTTSSTAIPEQHQAILRPYGVYELNPSSNVSAALQIRVGPQSPESAITALLAYTFLL